MASSNYNNATLNQNGTFAFKNVSGGQTALVFIKNVNGSPSLSIGKNPANFTNVKKELQIYDDFVQLASDWLVNNGFAQWQAIQWAQPSMQGLRTPLLLIDFYDSNRYGWTATKYVWDKQAQEGYTIIEWRKDLSLSFTFWRDRQSFASSSDDDLKNEFTAYDVANLFLAYLQSSPAREKLGEMGYYTLVEPNLYNGAAEDDSGKYNRFPVIRIKFVIREQISLENSENFITKEQQEEAFKNHSTQTIKITSTQGAYNA